jgi:peptidoglycan hydrolase CwlO-like protein
MEEAIRAIGNDFRAILKRIDGLKKLVGLNQKDLNNLKSEMVENKILINELNKRINDNQILLKEIDKLNRKLG